MSLKGLVTVMFIGCWVWCAVTAAYSPLNYACCVKYTRKPLPLSSIVGFALQSSREVCRIDAIIFLTTDKEGRKRKVCATREDEWVRTTLSRLSVKMRKMANPHSNRVIDAAARNTTATS